MTRMNLVTTIMCSTALAFALGCDAQPTAIHDAEPTGIGLDHADTESGLSGSVHGDGAMIEFYARTAGDEVTAEIYGSDGRPLWSYFEAPDAFIDIRIDEVAYSAEAFFGGDEALLTAMADLAESPEGRLIRELALGLVHAEGDPALVDERRGLETAFQALQEFFPATEVADATADYFMSPEAGFVVATQVRGTLFSHNATMNPEEAHGHTVTYDAKRPGQMGSCPCCGNCGEGCSNDMPYGMPDCNGSRWWSHYSWTITSGGCSDHRTTHTFHGKYYSGCEIHDRGGSALAAWDGCYGGASAHATWSYTTNSGLTCGAGECETAFDCDPGQWCNAGACEEE